MSATNSSEPARFGRFREAEQAVWTRYQLEPTEKLLRLESGRVVRMHEVGVGDPMVFVHGSGGSGAYWAPLVAKLASEYRCVLIDRPGWTLSTPIEYSAADFGSIAADLLSKVFDAIDLEKAHIVGGSIGNLYALRFAQLNPDRASSVLLLGGGPLISAIRPPTFVRLLRSPLGRVIVRIPQKAGMVRKQLEGLGHEHGLREGLLPDELIDLYVATSRYTAGMRHERDLVKGIAGRAAFLPGLTIDEDEFSSISVPTTMVYGSDDPVGDADLWRRFTRALPNGAFHDVADTGHLPWFDKPGEVADLASAHLRRARA